MENSQDIRTLTILHFNDSYNIEPSPAEPVGGAARFATALKSFEKENPIILFSGDLFSPSNCNIASTYSSLNLLPLRSRKRLSRKTDARAYQCS